MRKSETPHVWRPAPPIDVYTPMGPARTVMLTVTDISDNPLTRMRTEANITAEECATHTGLPEAYFWTLEAESGVSFSARDCLNARAMYEKLFDSLNRLDDATPADPIELRRWFERLYAHVEANGSRAEAFLGPLQRWIESREHR